MTERQIVDYVPENECNTICVNCRWILESRVLETGAKPLCQEPSRQSTGEMVDPVTGTRRWDASPYWSPSPWCSDINDGNCSTFTPKGLAED